MLLEVVPPKKFVETKLPVNDNLTGCSNSFIGCGHLRVCVGFGTPISSKSLYELLVETRAHIPGGLC